MFRVDLSALLWIFAAIWLLSIPLRWVAAAIFSIAVHEAAHIAVMYLLQQSVCRIRISIRGIRIVTQFDNPCKEFLCALAGPACSLLCVMMLKWFPRFAICCLFHGLYNLLPIGQQDGARILRSLLAMRAGEEKANVYSCIVEQAVTGGIVLIGIVMFIFFRMGCWPLLISIFLLSRVQTGKIPCKELQQRVQ